MPLAPIRVQLGATALRGYEGSELGFTLTAAKRGSRYWLLYGVPLARGIPHLPFFVQALHSRHSPSVGLLLVRFVLGSYWDR